MTLLLFVFTIATTTSVLLAAEHHHYRVTSPTMKSLSSSSSVAASTSNDHSSKRQLCGKQLSRALDTACRGRYYSPTAATASTTATAAAATSANKKSQQVQSGVANGYGSVAKKSRRKRSVVDDCCTQACSISRLLTYCESNSHQVNLSWSELLTADKSAQKPSLPAFAVKRHLTHHHHKHQHQHPQRPLQSPSDASKVSSKSNAGQGQGQGQMTSLKSNDQSHDQQQQPHRKRHHIHHTIERPYFFVAPVSAGLTKHAAKTKSSKVQSEDKKKSETSLLRDIITNPISAKQPVSSKLKEQ